MILRGGDEEAAAPKYAHIERERRFLVDPARLPDLAGAPFVRIEDRYIAGTRLRLRRMTDSATGRLALKLSKKYRSDDPLARPVVTTYLDQVEYDLFAGLPAAAITKRARQVEVGGVCFRVDRFDGPLGGLVLAEVDGENDAALRGIAVPPWATREVSRDTRFDGGNLAWLTGRALAQLLGSQL